MGLMSIAILVLVFLIAAIQIEWRVKRWIDQRRFHRYHERSRQTMAAYLRERHGDKAATSYVQQSIENEKLAKLKQGAA